MPSTPIKRTVIALSASRQPDRNSPRLDYVHSLLQMPLEHLGMVVHDVDLTDGAPRDVDMDTVRAIVTWFQVDDVLPSWVWPWLRTQRRRHDVRIVHFGSLQPLAGATRREHVQLSDWLSEFDLGWDAARVDDSTRVRVSYANRELCRYETPNWGPYPHSGPWSRSPRNRTWIATEVDGDSQRTPVVTGPWGGIALWPWALRVGGDHDDRRWHIDPFAFFREALALDRVPAPDPCVAHGRRMFFLHVDGDGFESESTVVPGQPAARVFLDRVIDRYDLPIGISIIVAGISDAIDPESPTPSMELAREILGRPNVEVASHSVLHPLNWRRRLTDRTPARTVTWYQPIKGYGHDMDAEVRDSIAFINRYLVPPGKRCEVMYWSGAANPTESALLAAAQAGCLNLNGGIYRWDEMTDSVGFVAPHGKRVGEAFQVYCGGPNENVYEGFFSTLPTAFGHVDRTIENTGRERILKPANVYVHFYSAERPGRLRSLEELIERWALREPTIAVQPSAFVRAVLGARTARISARDDGGFELRDYGGCRTFRLDREVRTVDWRRSRNIIGIARRGDDLFVDVAGGAATLFLTDHDPVATRPHIAEANHLLEDVVIEPRRIALRSRAWSPRAIVIGGFEPDAPLTLRLDGAEQPRLADRRGRVEIELPTPGSTEVEIRAR